MKLILEDNDKKQIIESVSELNIMETINGLSQSFSYELLESETGSYIQCAGNDKELIIEVRFYLNNTFKHFVIGKIEMSKIWATVNCKVGPITVLDHEVLTKKDAIDLFVYFFKNEDVLPGYNKRNITKNFR